MLSFVWRLQSEMERCGTFGDCCHKCMQRCVGLFDAADSVRQWDQQHLIGRHVLCGLDILMGLHLHLALMLVCMCNLMQAHVKKCKRLVVKRSKIALPVKNGAARW